MPLTLQEAASRKNNNFDFIRLVSAIAVIYGHSFYLFKTNGSQDVFARFLHIDSGGIAVDIFFFLSGIFITASYINSKTISKFILMRIYRIWPALIICMMITVLIVGPIFTTVGLHHYFSNIQTYYFFFKNASLIKFEAKLPGVFEKNLFNDSVNGSLWTLPNEIKCYILVLLLGMIGVFKKQYFVVITFIIFLVVLKIHPTELMKQIVFFFTGSLAYSFKQYVFIDYRIAIALFSICLCIYFLDFNAFNIPFYITLMYLMLFIGTRGIIRKVHLPGDYSYGIYIYGFLFQQILYSIHPGLNSYESTLIAVPVVGLIGVLSWHLIELPSINKGKKLSLNLERRKTVSNSILN